MQFRKYSLAVLTTFLVMFNAQSSHAFTITYGTDIESNISFDKVPYTEGNRAGESWVVPVRPLQRGGTPGLNT